MLRHTAKPAYGNTVLPVSVCRQQQQLHHQALLMPTNSTTPGATFYVPIQPQSSGHIAPLQPAVRPVTRNEQSSNWQIIIW